MSATILISLLIIWKRCSSGNLERVSGSLILTYFISPWKCKASGLALSWGNSNSISLHESVRIQIIFWQRFRYAYRLPWGRRSAQETTRWPQLLWKQQMPCGTLKEAMTPRSRLPWHREVVAQLQQTGRRVTKGVATTVPKVALLSVQTPIPGKAFVSFTTTTPTRPQVYFTLYLVRKLKSRQTPTGSAATSTKKLSNFRANFFLRSFCKTLWQITSWVLTS